MSCRGSHEVSALYSLKTIEGFARTSTRRSSCCFDITRHARRCSIGVRWCGGTPRHRARGNAKGWGRALARHRWMDVDHGLSFRASDLSAPLSRSRARPSRTGSPARHLAMPSRLPVPHVARQFTSTRKCCFPSTLSRSQTIGHRPTRAASRRVEVHSKSHPAHAPRKSRFAVDPTCRFSPLDKQLNSKRDVNRRDRNLGSDSGSPGQHVE